jgi:preprotein translocase subunit SecD
MIIGRSRFNIYLLSLLVTVASGCHTPKEKEEANKEKQFSTLSLNIEVVPSSLDFSVDVPVFRGRPMTVTVDKDPFLTESQVSEAKVVDDQGGFVLEIKFEHRGTALLEQYTTIYPGKHIAIFSRFGNKKSDSRWLAAPKITGRISSGILTFTPDATREEAEQIALGLNNVAKQVAKKYKW